MFSPSAMFAYVKLIFQLCCFLKTIVDFFLCKKHAISLDNAQDVVALY